MEKESSEVSAFQSSEFALLLFSHFKINGIENVDILQLAYVLTDLYPVNKTNFILDGFDLKETKYDTFILDIDPMLMDAYFLGYLDIKSNKINLNNDYINEEVIPKYNKSINDAFKFIAKSYVEKVSNISNISNKNYIGDLFKKYSFSRR